MKAKARQKTAKKQLVKDLKFLTKMIKEESCTTVVGRFDEEFYESGEILYTLKLEVLVK